MQLCHVTVVGALSPFCLVLTSRFHALPHRVGCLYGAVDLKALVHNRVRCSGLAFPPDLCPMLPWAFDPLKGSAAIPCLPLERIAGRFASPLLPGEKWIRSSCRENFRFGYGSTQSVETSCVPRRPGWPSARGQSVRQSASTVVQGPSKLRPLSPRGRSSAGRSQFCRYPFARSHQTAEPTSLFLTAIDCRVRPEPKRWAWRHPVRGNPPIQLTTKVPEHVGCRLCRGAGAFGKGLPMDLLTIRLSHQVPVWFNLLSGGRSLECRSIREIASSVGGCSRSGCLGDRLER